MTTKKLKIGPPTRPVYHGRDWIGTLTWMPNRRQWRFMLEFFKEYDDLHYTKGHQSYHASLKAFEAWFKECARKDAEA